jgi:hypothetical protein
MSTQYDDNFKSDKSSGLSFSNCIWQTNAFAYAYGSLGMRSLSNFCCLSYKKSIIIKLEWVPLNGITVYVIIRLMGSIFLRSSKPVRPFNSQQTKESICYHSVNIISLSWSQSDPIKQRLLYLKCHLCNLLLPSLRSRNIFCT